MRAACCVEPYCLRTASALCRRYPENSRDHAGATRAGAIFFAGVHGTIYSMLRWTVPQCRKFPNHAWKNKSFQQLARENEWLKEPLWAHRDAYCTIFDVLYYMRVQYSKFGLVRIWLLEASKSRSPWSYRWGTICAHDSSCHTNRRWGTCTHDPCHTNGR